MQNPKRWPTIIIFITMQLAWLIIVIMWVVWYMRYRHIKMQPIGTWDVVIIVEAAVLLILILTGIYALFILYQKQLTLMRTQMHIISSITHAFKTPLATMQLYLETINKRQLPEDTKNQLLSGMLKENQRLKSLVENFLESARLSYKHKPYIFSTLSATQLINEYIERHEILLRGVELHKDIKEDVFISVDSDAFDLAFSNLIENAIHYSTNIPQVDIKVWNENKWAYFEFSDTGIGIPKEHQGDVFKMFQRLPEAAALWGSGTGMGLYVVKEIIRAHGGNIKISGGAKRQGTSFLIRLPSVRI